nr:hypothetical protein Itr_chr05CG08660 [Ipomoea trifida]
MTWELRLVLTSKRCRVLKGKWGVHSQDASALQHSSLTVFVTARQNWLVKDSVFKLYKSMIQSFTFNMGFGCNEGEDGESCDPSRHAPVFVLGVVSGLGTSTHF